MNVKRLFAYGIVAVLAGMAAQPRRPLRVVGRSMAPTYGDGEWLWTLPVDRTIRRGDVIVIDTKHGAVIKRVALAPGDRHLEVRAGGKWVDTLGIHLPSQRHKDGFRWATVPPDTFFVLGDHLSVSVDSRAFGMVKGSDIRRIVDDNRLPSLGSEIAALATSDWRAT